MLKVNGFSDESLKALCCNQFQASNDTRTGSVGRNEELR